MQLGLGAELTVTGGATLSQVLWHLLDVSPALLSGGVTPHWVASTQDWLDRFGLGVLEG